ncbi:MAG: condensation domain-containing protein [Legionella sp.]
MQALNADNLKQIITSYFQPFFKDNEVNAETRLTDLGFESIDYIELGAYLFQTAGAWLDVSRIANNTKISNIASYVLNCEPHTSEQQELVLLDNFQKYVYTRQLKDPNLHFTQVTYVIHYLCLRQDVDLSQLKIAIMDTLNNHFLLNSKLIKVVDDYFFHNSAPQDDFTFKGSRFFPKNDLTKLAISVHSDRLVNIYLQRKRKQYYLIISFHHVALDGWAYNVVQEEIFRRYAGLYEDKKESSLKDIPSLNKIYPSSLNEPSNTDELRALFEPIEPFQFNHVDHVFSGRVQQHSDCFVITKENLNHYARERNLHEFPPSVVLAFMFYHLIYEVSGVKRLIIHTSLSNRNLPVPGIKELVANLATGLPLFLNMKHLEPEQFAAHIHELLKVYFKHMSYGAITRILLEHNTLLNEFISPLRGPYYLLFGYVNNISKVIYGNDSITNRYVDWTQSSSHLCMRNKRVFFDVYNYGTEFFIQIHSSMAGSYYTKMINSLLKLGCVTEA